MTLTDRFATPADVKVDRQTFLQTLRPMLDLLGVAAARVVRVTAETDHITIEAMIEDEQGRRIAVGDGEVAIATYVIAVCEPHKITRHPDPAWPKQRSQARCSCGESSSYTQHSAVAAWVERHLAESEAVAKSDRYFEARDGDEEPTIWHDQGDGELPVAVVRRCDLRDCRSWQALVRAMVGAS